MRRSESNPHNPWLATSVEWDEAAPQVELEITEVQARSILSKNDSPDLSFTYSLNPYQGCYHGCAYCYARPSHQYLQLGAGTDFERKIMVKVNAPERLREAFERPSWKGDFILFSGNTDCYQPLEASYSLTRRCLELCLEFRNPIGVITKGGVLARDISLLGALSRQTSVVVFITIPFHDERVRRAMEPFAAPIDKRFEMIKRLSEAGVATGIAIAPVIVGLNDPDVAGLLERAQAAGAERAFMTLLRLPGEVKDVFFERLSYAFPDRLDKVRNALAELRGGDLYDPRFGQRMRGEGKRWQIIEQIFDTQCQRLGLNVGERNAAPPGESSFRRPTRQLPLF
jgi:DNA repair photolyase